MSSWRGRRVTVTGGAGFLGSVLVERLRAAGAAVAVARRRDYDLTEREAALRLFEASRPDVLFHLAAAVGGIGANQAEPGRFFHDNMAMGLHVVEAARRYGRLQTLVLVGTTCAYPGSAPVPMREDALWDGFPEPTNAPYGVAKRALLVMAQAYRAQYGLNAIYLIPANLYGPGDNFDLETSHVIPALVRKCVDAVAEGQDEVQAWGDGAPTREFLHVRDAARGLMLAAERYGGAEPVNLGTGHEVSIRDLAETIAALAGFRGRITWDASRPGGQRRRRLDTTRARQAFGFEAEIALPDGLREVVDWYRAHRGVAARAPERR
ncbi:MAG: GDP-L-fucose synthase [Armatimonadota bacterium]|nr:GDP-L-fucose synthase [Armatimonadota bacterium]MDR7422314.1 GDP-L-fucose synthase [Armatimonadota bacterium]MDR7454360.1 GDP-L-fucose synthase [Armatimonadota bacterium]MDR7455968.1 GDP-L-fucose synthase [Armatimonadota bacterium]MDR7496161.1 GDP-L-fucose synthase [Armatimonadota bacterium]